MRLLSCHSPVVSTSTGKVKGRRRKTDQGRKIFSFTGIPYAKSPVRELRFRRSVPAEPWSGTLDGTRESEPNIQPNLFFPASSLRLGAEDCLYLNVYTPEVSPADLKPVLVFIHGGAFVVGSNDSRLYGPEILLDKDLVLVSMNYRLGPLGFLSLETDSAPGNLGLHDQFLALSWIQDNIRSFGGDPGNVTLMGESAGAMSALLHTVSPFSANLFHRVIALSGTPSTVFLKPNRRPRQYATALAERLGCRDPDPETILKFLQDQPVERIMKHCTMFMDWDYPNPVPWVPIVDNFSSQPFLPCSFQEAVLNRSAHKVPVLYCFCKDEGLLLSSPFLKEPGRVDLLRTGWDTWAPLLFLNRERDIHTQEDLEICRRIKGHYFSTTELDKSSANLNKLKDIYSMSYFVEPLFKDAELLVNQGWDVEIMRLSVPPAFSIFQVIRKPLVGLVLKMTGKFFGLGVFRRQYGVCHSDDLAFIFPFRVPGFPPTVQTQDQRFARTTLLSILETFSSGHPAFESLEEEGAGPHARPCDRFLSIEPGERVRTFLVNKSDIGEELTFWRNLLRAEKRTMSEQPFSRFYSKPALYRK